MGAQAQTLPNTRDIEPLSLRAAVRPGSVDAEARTYDLTWSTGAAARRYSWSKGEYIEELSLEKKHVRLGRLNNRAPLLDTHNGWGLNGILGVVEKARIEGKEGVATVRFPELGIDEDADRVFKLIADGIICHSSVGYRVYRYEITEEEGQLPIYRATDWEPYELSMVPMGVDDDATVRAEKSAETNPCEFVLAHRGADMAKPIDSQGGSTATPATPGDNPVAVETRAPAPVAPAPPTAAPAATPSNEDVIRAERERAGEIRRIASGFDLGDDFIARMDSEKKTVEEARRAAFELYYEARQSAPAEGIDGTVRVSGGEDLRRAASDGGLRNAILHSARPHTHELTDEGRAFFAMTAMEMARGYLDARGFRTSGMTRNQVAEAAMGLSMRGSGGQHSTSDFPFILADVATKELRGDYENSPSTFRAWCTPGTIPDFKEISINQLGDFPSLPEVLEGGEYEFGTIGEARELMSLSKFGRRIAFTWEMLINDDLDAFLRLAGKIGFAVSNLESDLVYDHFLANPTMGDGDALFHANHDNVGAGVIGVAGLSAGRAALRKQTGLNGRRINLMAKYLLVPAALETSADQIVATITPNQSSQVNPFATNHKLTPIAEPRLDDSSELEYYMAASPSQIENFRFAYLRGESGPMVTSRVGFEVDGLELKVKHVFGVKAIDHRGLYQSDGVDP